MRANHRFRGQPKAFWAHVRSISQELGYTYSIRKSKANPDPPPAQVATLTPAGIVGAMRALRLTCKHLVNSDGSLTSGGQLLIEYFQYRADVLNNHVRLSLMRVTEAKELYEELVSRYRPTIPPSMNRQKGEKRQVAYLASMVNVLVESVVGPSGFNPNPLQLTTFTERSLPMRTLARRVDGALPGVVNPVALWEVKEYYYTTTFGSRIADGIYETLLDGMELEEMREHTGRHCDHVLVVDAYDTWWGDGKAYLCRMIDILHMGYVDEVLFGREIVERVPELARGWIEQARRQSEPQVRGDEGDGLEDDEAGQDGPGLLDM